MSKGRNAAAGEPHFAKSEVCPSANCWQPRFLFGSEKPLTLHTKKRLPKSQKTSEVCRGESTITCLFCLSAPWAPVGEGQEPVELARGPGEVRPGGRAPVVLEPGEAQPGARVSARRQAVSARPWVQAWARAPAPAP